MEYFLGIDGGGTKTAYLLTDEAGRILASLETRGSSYKEYGPKLVAAELEQNMDRCLRKAKIGREELTGAAVGLPCFGECRTVDAQMEEWLRKGLSRVPVCITNDVEAGWAGSLGLKPGINVVAGTGSIAFGKNSQGLFARAGGWSTFFGDEGSCYWLGRRTMELFSKEADQRADRGPLYDLVRREFNLIDDMEFVDLMEQRYMPDRSRVASLQRLLLAAAKQGDSGAISLYEAAGEELGSMVSAVAKRIKLPGERLGVSYSGGLFHAAEYVLPTVEKWINEWGGYLTRPEFTPVQGAVLLAAQKFSKGKTDNIMKEWRP